MLPNNRVILSRNGALTDYSRELSDVQENDVVLSLTGATDILYLGSDLPFNHRHFQLTQDQRNAVAGAISVDLWDGSAWQACVDVLDMTAKGGIPFAKSGQVRFTPDRNRDWGVQDTTEGIAELSTLKIYNFYWARFKFSANFVFNLDYVGFKFSQDSDLDIYYRDLNRTVAREAFFDGPEPSYDTIHIAGAEEIIRDLRARKIMFSPNQILEPDQFRDSNSHKTAAIVYAPGGLNEKTKMDDAMDKYLDSMEKLDFKIDKAGNGKIVPNEDRNTESTVRRR